MTTDTTDWVTSPFAYITLSITLHIYALVTHRVYTQIHKYFKVKKKKSNNTA